jgi:hypothetical protein
MNTNNELSTETKNGNLDKPMLTNRFSHTLENCLLAKIELMKDGFLEEDFYDADEYDVEVGLILGEPIKKTNDDDLLTALEMYKNKCFSEEVDEDEMYDFFFGDDC